MAGNVTSGTHNCTSTYEQVGVQNGANQDVTPTVRINRQLQQLRQFGRLYCAETAVSFFVCTSISCSLCQLRRVDQFEIFALGLRVRCMFL